MRKLLLGAALLGLMATTTLAADVTLSNGLAGTSQYSVVIDENAYSWQAYIQAPGQGVENLMYDYIPYLCVGAGSARLGGGVWGDSDASDGIVTSGGVTSGIAWSVTHTLPAGGTVMSSRYTLTNATGGSLPALRFFQYLDEDVYGVSNNILVVSGSIAGGDLQLLTVEPTIRAGVSQSGDATATGWAADEWADLRTALGAGGYDAPPGGFVDTVDMPAIVDPYYGPAYGPADSTTCMEWQIAAGLTSFSFTAALGGLPEAPPPPGAIPEPATLALLGLGGLVALYRRRRAA